MRRSSSTTPIPTVIRSPSSSRAGPRAPLVPAVLGSDRSVTFTSAPGAAGTAVISYQVSDGELTDSAVLRVTVRPCGESAPVAGSPFLRTGYRQPIGVDLATYAVERDGRRRRRSTGVRERRLHPSRRRERQCDDPLLGGQQLSAAGVGSGHDRCQRRPGRFAADADGGARHDARRSGRPARVGRRSRWSSSGSAGNPPWVTTEADRLVVSPPIGAAPGSYDFTTTVADPGGLTSIVRITVAVVNDPPLAVADTVDVTGRRVSDRLARGQRHRHRLRWPARHPEHLDDDPDVHQRGDRHAHGRSRRAVRHDRSAGRRKGTATFTYTVRDADGGDVCSGDGDGERTARQPRTGRPRPDGGGERR